MKDSSLRVPPGMDGTVIDVQRVHPRRRREGQARAARSRNAEIKRVKKDFDDQFRILEGDDLRAPARTCCVGKVANGGPGLKKGDTVSSLVPRRPEARPTGSRCA